MGKVFGMWYMEKVDGKRDDTLTADANRMMADGNDGAINDTDFSRKDNPLKYLVMFWALLHTVTVLSLG